MVRGSLAAVAIALIAGCGEADRAPAPSARATPTATPAPERRASELVYFQRQGAGGATLDTIAVRRDGTASNERRYGGAGGRFKELTLRRGELRRVRRVLAGLPRRGASLTRGTPAPGGAQYLLRHRGRTLTGRQGGIAPAARPAIRLLDGFLDGRGVREVTRESSTGAP